MKNLKKQERPLMLKVMGKWFKDVSSKQIKQPSVYHDTQQDHSYSIIIISAFLITRHFAIGHFVD